ncbi:hypothetical protein B0H17DRAFT_1213299 [Mycena rosella]|uniref:Uncharacterized protein n=1 Tax=Mycena rosella TaxID=1033263 RepID=A0AAD7CQD6_MYCRO|nr:hypothetical protein B0H17DRAFT_1213299 [Mycena rosella]
MPQSRILGSSPSYLAAMCPGIILAIMRLSGPADLASIGSVCALFYAILNQNSSCWAYARERLAIPGPPCGAIDWTSNQSPIPISQSYDHGSTERALIAYLFRGGNCTPNCRERIFSIHFGKLVGIDPKNISKKSAARWLLSHETGSGGVYFKADVALAKATMRELRDSGKPLAERYYACHLSSEDCMWTFNQLEMWKPEYLEAVKKIKDLNLKFLKPIAEQERRKLGNLLKSPTLLRVFEAFNRDLTRMGSNDWRVIKDVVRRELKAKLHR